LTSIAGLIQEAGGDELSSLLDCTAFLRHITDAGAVRAALAAAGAEPALTVVEAGPEDPRQSVLLRCTAAVPGEGGSPAEARRIRTEAGLAVVTDRFVYTSGQLGSATNGTDAFAGLERLLKAAGATLEDVINCQFFVKDTWKVYDLFAGFAQVFNRDHPPPPSRTEFTAISECPSCTVAAKCIAARRATQQPALPLASSHGHESVGPVVI